MTKRKIIVMTLLKENAKFSPIQCANANLTKDTVFVEFL